MCHICYPAQRNTVCACKFPLIGVSHLPDQLSRGNGGGLSVSLCPAPERALEVVLVSEALPYHWAHFGANSACLRASEAPSAVTLPGLQFCLPFSCGVFRALQEITANCLDRESPFVPHSPSPFPQNYICTLSRQAVRIMNDACGISQSVYHML